MYARESGYLSIPGDVEGLAVCLTVNFICGFRNRQPGQRMVGVSFDRRVRKNVFLTNRRLSFNDVFLDTSQGKPYDGCMDMTSLGKLVRLIRYYILTSTTTAGSGHATSALSAVELATMLFFKYLRADLDHPENFANDRFILSKGHASPLLYALYAAAGKVTEEELLKLRTLESPLEGHPTMRFPWTEVPTGSLGQGLSVAIGEAIALRVKYQGFGIKGLGTDLSFLNTKYGPLNTLPRIFVLMGDGELAEGQIWEAIQLAKYYKLNNIIALIDVNRLGQSQETMYGTDARALATRIAGFGWKTYVVENGHDFGLLDKAYSLALEQAKASDVPSAILVRTVKGKGVSFLEDKEGWHGIALKKDELEKALGELGEVDKADRGLVQKPSMEYQGVSIKGLGSESLHTS
jgi:transketolase